MYGIVSSNSYLDVILWGPFKKLSGAKKTKKALEKAYPNASHLVLPFEDLGVVKRHLGEEDG